MKDDKIQGLIKAHTERECLNAAFSAQLYFPQRNVESCLFLHFDFNYNGVLTPKMVIMNSSILIQFIMLAK